MDHEASGGEMLRRMGTDGELWAQAFSAALKRAAPVAHQWLPPDPGELLHVWFVNAIEAGRSEGYSDGLRAAKLRERLRWRGIQARHDFDRKVTTPVALRLARRMPSWLRGWVVVQVCNEAIERDRRPDGYAGPDGITWKEMHDAAFRTPVETGRCDPKHGLHYHGSGESCDCGLEANVREDDRGFGTIKMR